MKNKGTHVEWTIVEEDGAWLVSQSFPPIKNPLRPEPAMESATESAKGSATKSLNRKEQVMAMVVVGFVLLAMGGRHWQQQRLAAEVPGELQAALMQNLPTQPAIGDWAQTTPFNSLFESSSVANAVAGGVQLQDYQQVGDRVMVQVTVEYAVEGKMVAHRETRFLEKKGNEWQRIAPVPGLMGPKQSLTIAHFTILYRAVDADAVYEVAPKLEKLYAKMGKDFGLSLVESSPIYTIEVAADWMQSPHTINFSKHEMSVPSPVLLSVPVEMTAATVLYQAMIYPLARLAEYESSKQHRAQRENGSMEWWPSVPRLLALWQVWEEGGALATGREEVVRWLYVNRGSDETQSSLPSGYERLCHTYRIWGVTPVDYSIPLTCTTMDRQSPKAQHYPTLPVNVQEELYPQRWTGTLDEAFDGVMLETVLAYIVATYGREQLPLFVTALHEHSTLETLIPAVFGLSSVEFEAGWQAYLAQRYQ